MENIMKTDIPFKKYLEIDAVNNSYLGKLAKCPANALIEDEDTEALGFGRALHTFVLEGQSVFAEQFVVLASGLKRNTKIGKEAHTTLQLSNPDKEIIKEDDFDKIKEMDIAIRSHPVAREILEGSVMREVTMTWTDRETGLPCKGRLDIRPPLDKRALVDLKSTIDASPRGFRGSVWKYSYHRQGAFYLDGANASLDDEHKIDTIEVYTEQGQVAFDAFIFIAVEKKAPYRVEVYSLSDGFIEKGRTEYKDLLKLHQECTESGKFPNYTSTEVEELKTGEEL